MSEIYQPPPNVDQVPHTTNDQSLPSPLVHGQQEYDVQSNAVAQQHQQQHQQLPPDEQRVQQQNSYAQYHQGPLQQQQQQQQQPPPQHQPVPQKQCVIYHNQQHQNQYQVLIPQQQQPMGQQQRLVMHQQQQQQQHFTHPVVVQQPHMMNQQQQQHVQQQQQHLQQQQHMQLPQQRQVVVQHQQYQHHPQQQHQMGQHPQQQYIMVQQQHQQHAVQHQRPQIIRGAGDTGSIMKRTAPVPVRLGRPQMPQQGQYQQQQQIQQPHQYQQQQLPQPNPQQVIQPQQQLVQPQLHGQQPTGVQQQQQQQPPKQIFVIQNGGAFRLTRPGVQVIRGTALPQGVQSRPMLQQHPQGLPRAPMRMAMRHPVVQHPQRLQFVAQGPQVVSMYQQQQPQQQQQQQWVMNGQQMQRPRPPPHQQQQPQPQLQFQPGQQPMRMRQPAPPQSVMPPQQQQQQQQPPFVTPAEIAYNVEHVFNENGREVRKMPIKMGDETIWVDCVESSNAVGDQQQDNGVMLELMDEPSAPVSGLQLGTPGGAGINRLLTSNQAPPLKNKNLTDEERERIVSEVVNDHISPALLGEKYGISVVQIRTWVKAAGLKLPSKYKQTKMKEIKPQSGMENLPGNQLQGGPPLPQQQQQQQQQLHPGPALSSRQLPSMPTLPEGDQQVKVVNSSGVGQQFNSAQPPAPTQPLVRPVQVGDVSNNGVMTQNIPLGQQQLPQRPGPVVPVRPTPPDDASAVKKVTAAVPVQYKPKLIPGKLALCKNCGFVSQDFNCCVRCKKPIAENCKTVVDPAFNKGDDDSKPGQSKADLRTVRIQHKPRKKNANDEPECIALSSDEDEEDEVEEKKEGGDDSQPPGDGAENVEGSKTSGGASSDAVDSSSSSLQMPNDDREKQIKDEIQNLLDGNHLSQFTTLTARSIRVGSYKSFSKEKIVFIDKAIQITVPAIFEPQVMSTFVLMKNDIVRIQAHFGRGIPALFVFASPSACAKIRTTLKMNKATGLWLDLSLSDESMRRITILPEKITEETKSLLLRLYNGAIEEIDGQMANDILVKSSPKDSLGLRMMQQQGQQHQLTTLGGATVSAVKRPTFNDIQQNQIVEKYCQFPPTGSNSISVTTEDYVCLEDETFLNDVIIDFFFKWLQFDQMSEIDRNRTHIFSTFFYKRLTMRPQIQKNKLHPVEDDVNLTQAQKRYARVKRWTKSVNIFDKDFIVVPINEHSHWFVAVICFPGLENCRDMDTNETCEVPTRQVKAAEAAAEKSQKNKARKKELGDKKVMQIGSTSIIPLKPGGNTSFLDKMSAFGDEMSDKDEASASEDDLVDEEELTLHQKAAAAMLKAKTEEAKSAEASAGNSPKNSEAEKEKEKEDITEEAAVAKTVTNGETDKSENLDENLKIEPEEVKVKPEEVKNEPVIVKSETEESAPLQLAATESTEEINGSSEEKKPLDESPQEVKSEPLPAEVKSEPLSAEVKSEPLSTEVKSEPLSAEVKLEIKSEPADIKTEKPVKIKQPCILIFDSLQTGSRAKVAATLRDYLECEYREKIGKDRVFNKTTIRGCCPKVPQQPNFSDCGIFVLQYIESFFKNPITDFCLPIIDLRRWFTPDVVRNKRSNVAKTIRELAAKQNPNKKFNFPSLTFTAESGSGYTDDEDNSDEDASAPMKRNATLIKVGGTKISTPTKIPPGIIVTTVGSSSNASTASNRMMSAPVTSASFSVTSTSGNLTSSNITPGKGGVIFIKKGNKIDLLPNTPMAGKKHKIFVPKITRPVVKTSVPAGLKVISITNKVKLDKVESPDSATDPEPSTTATSTSLSTSSSEAANISTENSSNVADNDQMKETSSPSTEVVEKMEQDDQVSTNNVTPTKADVDDNSPTSSSGCKRSIAESSSEKSSPVQEGEAEKNDDTSLNGSEAKKAKIEAAA